jgi:hypothetical protein
MPIPAGYSRLTLHGTAGGDIFETGLYVHSAPATQADAQTLANDAWNSWLTSGLTGFAALLASDGFYTGLRAYCYPGGGPKAQFIAEAVATPTAGTGTHFLPLQVACVVTLQTGAAGRSSRGRMYLPADGATMGADHQFASVDVNQACVAVAGWCDALNTAGHQPVVLSTLNGTSRPITACRADTKADIQRRRANRQVAASASVHAL